MSRSTRTKIGLASLTVGVIAVPIGITALPASNHLMHKLAQPAAAAKASFKLPKSCKNVKAIDQKRKQLVEQDLAISPYDSKTKRDQILMLQVCLLDLTPAGEHVGTTTFSLSIPAYVEAVERADKRGVYQTFVMWDQKPQVTYSAYLALKAYAKKADSKYLKLIECEDACYKKGADKRSHHAKAFVTSAIRLYDHTYEDDSVITSENLSGGSADTSYNTAALVMERHKIAGALFDYTKHAGDNDTKYFKTVNDGPHSLQLFPTTETSKAYKLIHDVRCAKDASEKKPCIRIMMYSFSNNEMPVAKDLAARQKGHEAGAVKIVTNKKRALYVIPTLQDGKVSVRTALIGNKYVHSKDTVVCGDFPGGEFKGDDVCYRVLGDTNYTASAQNEDDLQLITKSKAIAKQHFSIFNGMKTKAIAPMK